MGNVDQGRLIAIGLGGLVCIIKDIVELTGKWKISSYLDDDPARMGTLVNGIPVMGGFDHLADVVQEHQIDRAILAIGGIHHMLIRARYFTEMLAKWKRLAEINLIHPAATVSPTASLGIGNILCVHSVINPGARVGNNCVLYTGAVVEHDCVLADNVYLAPGVHLGGRVSIGKNAYIGIGANVIDHISIGENSIIGAGALVLHDVEPNVICYGVPARPIRDNDVYRSC